MSSSSINKSLLYLILIIVFYYHSCCLSILFVCLLHCMMHYSSVYPWAKRDVLRETSVFTSVKIIKCFRHTQSLICSGVEGNIIVVPCAPDELVCKDFPHGEPFCFFYETLFTKLGIRLSLVFFRKKKF